MSVRSSVEAAMQVSDASSVLSGIHPESYMHPMDRASTAALSKVPQLTTLSKKYLSHIEWIYRAQVQASGVRLGPAQLAEIYGVHVAGCRRLDLRQIPELYLLPGYSINASAFGANRPIVTIDSRTVEALEISSVRAVLGHEAGHIHCDHSSYGQLVSFFLSLIAAASGGVGGVGALPMKALTPLLLQWQRSRELSCDRAAALVVGDAEPVCQMLMFLAAGTSSAGLSLPAFIQQASDYSFPARRADKALNALVSMRPTHPVPVRRMHLLMEWISSGAYEQLLKGDSQRSDRRLSGRSLSGDYLAAARLDRDVYTEQMDGLAREAERELDAAFGEVDAMMERGIAELG